jgi:hypothetical protein
LRIFENLWDDVKLGQELNHSGCFPSQLEVAINHPAILHLKIPSTEDESASDKSAAFKIVVVKMNSSVF